MTTDPLDGIDFALLGARIRHVRQARGMTLAVLSRHVDRAPSLLSQIENGKREPNLPLLTSIAHTLAVPLKDLLKQQAPSERSALELELKAMQASPIAAQFSIPDVHVGPRLPTDALKALVEAYRSLHTETEVNAQTSKAARAATLKIRQEMRDRNNYLPDIEQLAAELTASIGHEDGPLPQSGVRDLATHLGFTLVRLPDLPNSSRSITDLRLRRIYISTETRAARDPRLVILRALGDQALGHVEPRSMEEFLRQRLASNYFAAAVLMPESTAVRHLREAMERRDLAMPDLRDVYSVSYEAACQRFTNLATQHLGIPCHFLRVGPDGIMYKAYSNDGIQLNRNPEGSIEGQRACRQFGARRAFQSTDYLGPHYQYTDTPTGTYFSVSRIEVLPEGDFSICIGVPFDHAGSFRGRDTTLRLTSTCPDTSCCRSPNDGLQHRWATFARPSPKVHSHMLAAIPPGTFPGVDDREVYEFLEKHSAESFDS